VPTNRKAPGLFELIISKKKRVILKVLTIESLGSPRSGLKHGNHLTLPGFLN
jgi:hypothetical protein